MTENKPKAWRRYMDGPLIAFVVVMVAAASITSHGTYLFYSLILPWWLAAAATLVLTAGIPLLELAAVLDKQGRPRYIIGMVVLLGMEALAQYFQGQAYFVSKVQARFPHAEGVDLATFAVEPRGRILPILFLALLSGVVVYFGYAASKRIRDLRMVAQTITEPCAVCAEHEAHIYQLDLELADRMSDLARLHGHVDPLAQSNYDLSANLKQARTELAQKTADLARLQGERAQPVQINKQAIVEHAQTLRETTGGWRAVAQLMDIPEATLRKWVDDLAHASNGHSVEVTP